MNRGDWEIPIEMQYAQFKLGYLSEGATCWFNYTRNFPAGRYYVYAALSHESSTPGVMRGRLARVTCGAGTTTQRVSKLGEFRADGSGSWDRFVRVPLTQDGQVVALDLAGLATLRYTSECGDFDYLLLRPESLPEAAVTPSTTEAAAGSTVFLSASPSGSQYTYQWRKGGQDIPGATEPTLALPSVTFVDAASYTVRIGNDSGAWQSTPATVKVYYALQIPAVVAPDQPAPGAGVIQPEMGSQQEHYYRFPGHTGQALSLAMLGSEVSSWTRLLVRLQSPNGDNLLFLDSSYGGWWYGFPSGTVLLPENGEYTLNVSVFVPADEWCWGCGYSFALDEPSTVQTFPIQVGDGVPESLPMEGVGTLENSGELDVFELTVDAPVDVYFWDQDSLGQRYMPRWALLDPEGELVFLRPEGWMMGYARPSTYRLDKAGVYRILVSSGLDDFYSFPIYYGFQLLPKPVQEFTLRLGDRIAPDQPAAGAGRLDGYGSMDSYRFRAKAGQSVYVVEQIDLTQSLGALFEIVSPSGRRLVNDFIEDACTWGWQEPFLVDLPETGVYQVNVWPYPGLGSANGYGTYALNLFRSVPVQSFLIEPGEVVKRNHTGGRAAIGAGYLDPNGTLDVFTFQLKTDAVVTLVDLGSDHNRLQAGFGRRVEYMTEPLFTDVLNGVNPSSVWLVAGIYEVRVSAQSGDFTASGNYSFMVKVN